MVIFKMTVVDVPYFIPSSRKIQLTLSMISIEATCRLLNATPILTQWISRIDIYYEVNLYSVSRMVLINRVELGYLEILAVISIFVCVPELERFQIVVYSTVIALT